ncbi:tetratricopeptide repeat protein 7B-like isoform X2 [Lineus longissimus]|uniref:tetratricopeptide repeat protein 7B-like isoform X2 n=1 Tax=Lineus longissimus TaxID=88925 RepID=UPI00315D256F
MLLLAKLEYYKGKCNEALSYIEDTQMDQISLEVVTSRMLRIIAESYAIKGMCLEKIPLTSTSKFKMIEREEKTIRCYEVAGDLALLHLQELDKSQRSTGTLTQSNATVPSDDEQIGPILESALQRSPILYIKAGQLPKAVGRFRELLRAVEARSTASLRQILARQLAEVLLRGVCEKTYIPVNVSDSSDDRLDMISTKPRKYSGDRIFNPRNETEESLLLLLMSECMANRDVILSRSPEFEDARKRRYTNIAAVYDLLTIVLVKRAQSHMLCDIFERAMKFSFDEFHIWYQFALSLICSEKYTRAVLVLDECSRLNPQDPVIYLQKADIYFYHLHMFDKGIEAAEAAVALGECHPLAARACVVLGSGYGLKANESRIRGERQELTKKAMVSYSKAYSIDSNDYLAVFHLALQLAQMRHISEAMKYVKEALRLRNDHLHSLHLLALLLSVQKQYGESLELVNAALDEYPDDLNLLFTKSKLEQAFLSPQASLVTCRHMFSVWKTMYQPQETLEQPRGTGLLEKVMSDKRALTQLQLTELSDRDSGSIRAESIAASRVEHALSEVASSLHSTLPKQAAHQSWAIQSQIWLHLAELYLTMDKPTDAMACVQEASSLLPLSHQVSYMRGRVHEHKLEFYEAKKYYDISASINPGYVNCLQHLGIVLHHIGQNRLAEKVLRDAVNADPTAGQSWHCLGEVLQSLGDCDAASECLFTASDLEATNPIVPFHVIPRPIC